MEIDEAEVLFAQKLADCDPAIRRKAFSRLRRWVATRMKSKDEFERSELITLWKGLYYCMWMQDKPLLHEELADRLCTLSEHLTIADQRILYYDTFYETINREWNNIDHWRVDKYLMLFRRLFRSSLNWLKSENYDDDLWQQLSETFSKTVWSESADSYAEELKSHFASIYLDELDAAGVLDLPSEKVFQFFDAFIELLAAPISDFFFQAIVKEIFDTILVDFAENVFQRPKSKKRKKAESMNPVESAELSKIDYGAFADVLLESGKTKSLKSKRRKSIYLLTKRFRAAAAGEDPFVENIRFAKGINEEMIHKSALELLKLK